MLDGMGLKLMSH